MMWPFNYICAKRQVADWVVIENLQAEIMERARDGGYYVPRGFELEQGALGSTTLHQAFRQLIAEGKIERVPHDGWGDRWKATT